MTRTYVYSTALVAFLIATGLTFAAIFVPDWITWSVETSKGEHFTKKYGLHRSYSSTTGKYSHFPQQSDCTGEDRYFCSMWRSVGFLMSLSAVVELATIVAYVVVLVGGKQKREHGWKIMVFLLMFVGVMQCVCMAIMAYLFDNDDRFFVGWKLDKSWGYCTASWCIAVLSAFGLWLSAVFLPVEDGYELIPSERHGG